MADEQHTYRNIFKATTLFGGVQVFNIFIAIIRSKFIAVLLGPTGMGIAGLLTSTTGLIEGITSLKLGTSAVKSVSEANASGNEIRLSIIITTLKRWIWISGVLGTLVTIVFSHWLSKVTFGNYDFSFAFIWISITLLFNQLATGQLVILQGIRRLKFLAKANMIGSLIGLFVSVPLYYLWGIKAIVPAIIIVSGASLLLAFYYGNKIKIKRYRVSAIRSFAESKNMVSVGFLISLSAIITLGTAYLVRIYISNSGGIAQVGLYNAGFAIINSYVGLIFTAMTTDYYPRLSAVAKNNELCKKTINQQAEMALLILAPIIVIFLVFINWVVVLFYSNKFSGIDDMILWAALGMFFKTVGWSIGYLFYSKGDGKLIFWSELIMNIYMGGLNILGYKLMGLTGIGISFILGYILSVVQVYLLAKIKYEFEFNRGLVRIFLLQFLLSVVCLVIIKMTGMTFKYIAGSIIILISAIYSYSELDRRMDLKKSILVVIRNISNSKNRDGKKE